MSALVIVYKPSKFLKHVFNLFFIKWSFSNSSIVFSDCVTVSILYTTILISLFKVFSHNSHCRMVINAFFLKLSSFRYVVTHFFCKYHCITLLSKMCIKLLFMKFSCFELIVLFSVIVLLLPLNTNMLPSVLTI